MPLPSVYGMVMGRVGTPVCLQHGKTMKHPTVHAGADLFNSATLLCAVILMTCPFIHRLLCTLLCRGKSTSAHHFVQHIQHTYADTASMTWLAKLQPFGTELDG